MGKRVALTVALLTTIGLGLSSDAAASTIYSAAPIPVPAGWVFGAPKINDLGQVIGDAVVGYDAYGNDICRGIMWDRRTHTTYVLPDLPGGKDESHACGINNSGQVAGYSSEAWAGEWYADAAVLWTPTTGEVRVLDHRAVPNPNITHNEYGMAINSAGWVAGSADGAARWDLQGHLQELGGLTVPNNGSYGLDINDSNEVVGWAYINDPVYGLTMRAFLWDPGPQAMYDLGVLPIAGHWQSDALAINNLGNAVGWSEKTDYRPHAFYKSRFGSMVSIEASLPGEVLCSTPTDINDSNQVVGYWYDEGADVDKAFVWDPVTGAKVLTDLVDSSGHGMSVRYTGGINNGGEVVAWLGGGSSWDWYILTPHELDSDPLPQGPGVGASLLGGSGGGQPGGVDFNFSNVSAGGTLSAVYQQTDPASFAAGYLDDPSDVDFILSGLPGGNVQFWDVSLEGGAFDRATLTVHYDEALLPVGFDETTLGISHYHDGVWENLPIVGQDVVANTLTFETTSFSLLVATPEPATLGLLMVGGLVLLRRRMLPRAMPKK